MTSSAQEPRPSTVSERQKLVAEYEQNLQVEKDRTSATKQTALARKRAARVGLLILLLGVSGYLWLSPPAWIRPQPIPVPPPAVREAGKRFSMILQAQRIEHFRLLKGRLPTTLAEAGEPIEGIDYAVLTGATYSLQSARDPALRYVSTDSLNKFVGGSIEVLGNPNDIR
jgi:hypothetical protein